MLDCSCCQCSSWAVSVFAAGRRAHGEAGAHWGPVVACEEGPRPSVGTSVSGEPLPPGCAAAWWVTSESSHCSCTPSETANLLSTVLRSVWMLSLLHTSPLYGFEYYCAWFNNVLFYPPKKYKICCCTRIDLVSTCSFNTKSHCRIKPHFKYFKHVTWNSIFLLCFMLISSDLWWYIM